MSDILRKILKFKLRKFEDAGYDCYLLASIIMLTTAPKDDFENTQRAIRLYRYYWFRKFFILSTIITDKHVIVFLPINVNKDCEYKLGHRTLFVPCSKFFRIIFRVWENMKLLYTLLMPHRSGSVVECFYSPSRASLRNLYLTNIKQVGLLKFWVKLIKTFCYRDLAPISILIEQDCDIRIRVNALGYLFQSPSNDSKITLWLDSFSIFLNFGNDNNLNDGTKRKSPLILGLSCIDEVVTPVPLDDIFNLNEFKDLTVRLVPSKNYKFPQKQKDFFAFNHKYAVFFADNPVSAATWSYLCFPSYRQTAYYMMKAIKRFSILCKNENLIPVIAAKRGTLSKRKIYSKFLYGLNMRYGTITTNDTIDLTDKKLVMVSGQPNTTPLYYATHLGVTTFLPWIAQKK